MDQVWVRNEDGTTSPAEAIPMRGWKAKCEEMFYFLRMKRAARFMGRWDERGLGR